MNIRFCLVFIFFIVARRCGAQLQPQQNARLNYTQVMFECGQVKGAGMYIFQITDDTTNSPFNHSFIEQRDSATATLVTGLQFGKKYQWRYAGIKKDQPPVWKGPYRFEIATDSLLHYNLVNYSVTKNDSTANAGGLIMNDCIHSVFDRNGNLVWYLPKITWYMVFNKKNFSARPQIFDLRLTSAGTFTYLADSIATECDLNGKTLWKAPNDGKVSGEKTESYNHDFKRLPNGHYMLLGNQNLIKLPAYKDTTSVRKKYPVRQIIDGDEYGTVEFATIIEYDKRGKVVWSWNSENYFKPDVLSPLKDSLYGFELKPHINAFSIDKKNEFVYAGFRNLSRIIKIEKTTGKVVDSWGDKKTSAMPTKFVELSQQHDANILDDGTIAVFNNNDYPGKDSFASVLLLSQQGKDSNCVIWKFNCDFDSLNRHDPRNGGNVDQLKNGNLLVCMGNMNRIFEVSRNKKIVWAATLTSAGKTGDMFFHRLYRAHYISSLYPCYFTFQTREDTIAAGLNNIHLRIFNKGSESDAYEIKILSGSGNSIADITTGDAAPNTSLRFEIKPRYELKAGDPLVVVISSKANPDLQRSKLLTVNKQTQ